MLSIIKAFISMMRHFINYYLHNTTAMFSSFCLSTSCCMLVFLSHLSSNSPQTCKATVHTNCKQSSLQQISHTSLMLGLLLYIYLAIFSFSIVCFVCYLKFWWCRKNGDIYGSDSNHRSREYDKRRYKYSLGVDNESSISSAQGTTMLIVHNAPMGFISEELDEDIRRCSMNSDNSSFIVYSLSSPEKTSVSERKMKGILWEKCILSKTPSPNKMSQDIVIRVEDYDEIQNEPVEVSLKGNLDLPMGEEPQLMEDKPMPAMRTTFTILNLKSKDSEVLV